MSHQDETPKKKKSPRKSKALAVQAPAPIVHLNFDTDAGFGLAQRRATALAGSSVVPERFRGPPGSEGYCNTLLALELAHRLNFPPMLVMQNLSVIDGKPSWQGKFYVALVQGGGRFENHFWDWTGEIGTDSRGARMVATRVSDGRQCEGAWVTVKMAKEKGWWSKIDRQGVERSHWPSMTEQMLMYRSAAFWANVWDPGATLGLRSAEEELDSAQPPPLPVAPPPPPVVVRPHSPRQAAEELRATPAAHLEIDTTLDPGIDPPSMSADPNASAADIVRRHLQSNDLRAALVEITRLPPGPLKESLKQEYTAARTRNPN